MKINISVLILGILFVLILIIKIVQNYKTRSKKRRGKKKEILKTSDVINTLFNVGLITAGAISIILALGFSLLFPAESLVYTQPVINFLAGVLFIWFAIRNIFYGGKT